MKFINKGLALFIFAAVLAVNSVHGQGEIVDKIVAKVDDYIILKSDVEQAYASFLASGQASSFDGDARCLIVRKLIEDKLMLAMSEIDSVELDDSRVDYELQGRMQRIMQQFGTEQAIQKAYGKSVDQIMDELRPAIEEQLTVRQQEENVLSDVTVTPAEIKKFFNSIPKDSLPLYNTEYEIGVILKEPKPSEAEVQRIKEKLMAVRERALKGESFEILAIEFSEGPSAPNGGDLGFAARGAMDPAYEAGALALKPGEISMPIVSSFGVHLIQLIEKRGNEYNSRHIIMMPKASEAGVQKSVDFLDSLRNQIIADSITFESAAKQYSDDESTKVSGGFLTGQFGSSKIAADALDPTLYFALEEMKEGEISKAEVVDFGQDKKAAQIIYYKSRTSPHKANLTDDYEKMKAATLQMKKAQKRSDYIKEKMEEVYILVDPEFNRCGIVNN